MKTSKKALISIAQKVEKNDRLTPQEVISLMTFNRSPLEKKIVTNLKQVILPLALVFGFIYTAFPSSVVQFTNTLPHWTNLPEPLLAGIDYWWDILGEPVGKANLVYHIPNIIVYAFGFFGLKKLFEAIEKKSWLDRVLAAQKILMNNQTEGNLNLRIPRGHSLLFVGNGDFIGRQFTDNHKLGQTVTITSVKPSYTPLWNLYQVDTVYEDLKSVITRSSGDTAGEYVFFPVKDDQIFLPGPTAYDLSPHKLDILCQNIRVVEKEQKWKPKRIIIVGDKFHKSYVQSEDSRHVIKNSGDTISLGSIAKKYTAVTLLDPTDIVLRKVIEIASGRKIVFRATKEGLQEYKKRFYDRLTELGYEPVKQQKGVLTIGYDLFEDQTEQQTLARNIDDYFPVVLSKNVRDALIRNGYKSNEFLYVPELVLSTLNRIAEEQ